MDSIFFSDAFFSDIFSFLPPKKF